MEEGSFDSTDSAHVNFNKDEQILDVANLNTVDNSDLLKLKTPRASSETSFATVGGERGWKFIRHNLPKVLDYGRREGLIVQKVETEDEQKIKKQELKKVHDDEAKGPNKEFSFIHSAIPFLPIPAALICCVLNFILPGSGTFLMGLCTICMGHTRIQVKEGKVVMTVIVNTLVAVCQLGTITFFFVGWFWSMAWGGLLLMHSVQHRESRIKKRQVAVATAAIEALTSNALLHRRKVNTLIEEHQEQKNSNNTTNKIIQERKNSAIMNAIIRSVSSSSQNTDVEANQFETNLTNTNHDDQDSNQVHDEKEEKQNIGNGST